MAAPRPGCRDAALLIGKCAAIAGRVLRKMSALLRIPAYPVHEAGSSRASMLGLAKGISGKLPTMAMTA